MYSSFGKRMIDVILSLIGLILLSPIFLVIIIIIKIDDPGPAFFKQKRVGINKSYFNLYKFRSMIENAEGKSGAVLASKSDSRITPVGKFIRATRLDELPQLINVLKGDMSLVGPRPERPEIAEQYYENLPEFAYRLKTKAGLTGYAQVMGKYNTTPYDKLKLDLTYIEKYSVPLDIKLILLTVKIFFKKETSEGIEDGQTTALRYDDGDKNDR